MSKSIRIHGAGIVILDTHTGLGANGFSAMLGLRGKAKDLDLLNRILMKCLYKFIE